MIRRIALRLWNWTVIVLIVLLGWPVYVLMLLDEWINYRLTGKG